MNSSIVTGIDIGGSHITAALVDLEAHAIVPESLIRRDIDSRADAETIIDEWCRAIRACKLYYPQASHLLGIAMPGPFDYEEGICGITGLDKYEALYQLNVKKLMAAELQVPLAGIQMMNDASCFLKGEVFGGAAKEKGNVIGITLGTGLGSAVFTNGSILDGDLYCAPFRDSTAEDYLSTRWFTKTYRERTGTAVVNVKALFERVQTDACAAGLFIEFGANLGAVLCDYVTKHRVDTVVVGGNIIKAWDVFIPATEKVLQEQDISVSLLKAALGEEAALLGAGSLFV